MDGNSIPKAIPASSKEGQEAWAYWMCPTKPGYSTIPKARLAAKDSLEKGGDVAALYGYKCRHCRKFHLTKKRNKWGALAVRNAPNARLSGAGTASA